MEISETMTIDSFKVKHWVSNCIIIRKPLDDDSFFFFLHYAEKSTLMNPLQPCCEGNKLEDSCGSVDDEGSKKYSLCENPKLSFFWDTLHPSQNGWFAVYTQ